MTEDRYTYVREQLSLFFDRASLLDRHELRRLERLDRGSAGTRLTLLLEPDFLTAVASGAWTPAHRSLAEDVHRSAQACARRGGVLRRRRLARALEHAGLAVLTDSDPGHPLPSRLRDRLAGPWVRAVGQDLHVATQAA